MAKAKRISGGLLALLTMLALVLGFALGACVTLYLSVPESGQRPAGSAYVEALSGSAPGEMNIHFLELGNKYTGDCTYIQVGEVDILIDAGSRTGSIPTISAFLDSHMTDDLLDYVIVTHAHQDHYAGFATGENQDSLFDLYQVGTIIDFALTNSEANMYQDYLRERQEEIDAGATHLTARECIEQNKATYELASGITMQVLDQRYYYEEASTENDYSVCLLFSQGDYHYLFTGDLEEKGEQSLVERNSLPEVLLYKAGHHGSKTSSTSELLSVIKPHMVCVCCCAGSPEYTKTDANQFPTQEFVNRISPYTELVYVTTRCLDYSAEAPENQFASMNGNITVTVRSNLLAVVCSSSDLILKEWEWFREHRTMPDAWK